MHDFAFPARKGLDMFRHKSGEMELGAAFVIQGEGFKTPEEELPENLLGCAQMFNLDLSNAQVLE